MSGAGPVGRVLAAWHRPLGPGSPVPAWLKRQVILTEREEESFQLLRNLAAVRYDASEPVHERELRRLFGAVRSPEEAGDLPAGKDPRWKELGFQAEDPRTDFRGGGLLALQNLVFLAETFPEEMARMLQEGAGRGADGVAPVMGEYLVAASGVVVSAMLVQMLGLNSSPSMSPVRSLPCPVHAVARKNFARALRCEERAPLVVGAEPELGVAWAAGAKEVFGELFSAAALKLHAEWKAVCARKPGATLLDFGEALGATAVALERLLGGLRLPSVQNAAAGVLPMPPARQAFAALEFIDPSRCTTGFQNSFAAWHAGVLEGACHLFVATAQLWHELGLPALCCCCCSQRLSDT